MAVFFKSCALLFIVCLIHRGSSCSNADLKLNQVQTGVQVGGKPEYKFSLGNTCSCVFLDITLNCGGFQTAEKIEESVLRKDGDDCMINNGNPIAPSTSLYFDYAWDHPYNFTLKNAQIACS